MMKNVILLFFLLFSLNLYSQYNFFGSKTGLNLAKIRYSNQQTQDLMKGYMKLKPGINLGLIYQIFLNKRMNLQFEFIFSQKGLKYKQIPYSEGKIKTNYLEFPALLCLKYRVEKNTNISPFFGPYIGYWIYGKYEYFNYTTGVGRNEYVDFSANYKYNRWDSGIIAGTQIVYSKNKFFFGFDARYQYGIIGSSVQDVDEYRHRVVSINFFAGYVFRKK